MGKEVPLSPFYQKLALWLVFGLIFVFMWNYFSKTGQSVREISYSDFLERVEQGHVRAVRIEGEKVIGEYVGGEGSTGRFKTYIPRDTDLIRLLREKRVSIKVDLPEKNSYIMQFLLSWAPVLLLIGLWVFFMRQMQSGGSKALSFGKSRARLLSDQKKKATFADVAGVDEAKAELEEIIDFLKIRSAFRNWEGRSQRGAPYGATQGLARPCSRAPLQVRQMCLSSVSVAPILSKCSLV